MERILTRIRMGDVRYRHPYYVKCSFCGIEIEGRTAEEVADKANMRGWKYDYREDLILCPNCLKELEKEEETKQGGKNEK